MKIDQPRLRLAVASALLALTAVGCTRTTSTAKSSDQRR
jgi:hypothetical protein